MFHFDGSYTPFYEERNIYIHVYVYTYIRAYYIHKGLLFACMATACLFPYVYWGRWTHDIYIRHGVTPHSSKCVLLQCQWYDPESWWRHQMETFSALLAIRAGNSPVPGEFPAQRPVTRSFDVFFDLRPSKQWLGWWFETLSRPLWRDSNVICVNTSGEGGGLVPSFFPDIKYA